MLQPVTYPSPAFSSRPTYVNAEPALGARPRDGDVALLARKEREVIVRPEGGQDFRAAGGIDERKVNLKRERASRVGHRHDLRRALTSARVLLRHGHGRLRKMRER